MSPSIIRGANQWPPQGSTRATAIENAAKLGLLPTTLANLVYWFAPELGLIPVDVAAGTQVLQWSDASGLGQNIAQATGALQPSYIDPAAAFLRGYGGVQTGPKGAMRPISGATLTSGGGNLNTNAFAFYALMAPIADVTGQRAGIGFSAAAEIDFFEFPDGTGNVTPVMIFPLPGQQALYESYTGVPVLFSITNRAGNIEMYANGVLVAQVATGASAFSNLVLGSTSPASTNLSYPAQFTEVLGFSQNHTVAQRQKVEAYIINKYGAQVVLDGNSQIAGGHTSGGGTAIPGRVGGLCPPAFLATINNGTNGITTPQLTARMATTAALFNSLAAKRWMAMLEIENDLFQNGASTNANDTTYAATAWANLMAYSRAARSFGIQKVVLCTGLPIGPAGVPPANYENLRLATNALARQNALTTDPTTNQPYFDGVADGGGSPLIGFFQSVFGPYYTTDQTHLNDAGSLVQAQLIAAQLQAFVDADTE